MLIHPLNLYAHFLDRELRESVNARLPAEDLVSYLILAFLVSPGSIYCSFSHLWESRIVETMYKPIIMRLLETRSLIPVSDYVSGAEFLESRQDLYAHDKTRYPQYFNAGKSKVIKSVNPVVIAKGERTTTILATNIDEWSQDRTGGTLFELRAKVIATTALRNRKGEAITYALFRQEEPNDTTALGVIRREISLNYVRRYLRTCMGDIATGLPGLEFYDNVALQFPVHDLPLLRVFLDAVSQQYRRIRVDPTILSSMIDMGQSQDAHVFREAWKSSIETIAFGIQVSDADPSTSRTLILDILSSLLNNVRSTQEISFSTLAEAAIQLSQQVTDRFGEEGKTSMSGRMRVLLVIATDMEQEKLLEAVRKRTKVTPYPGYAVPLWTATLDNRELFITRCVMGQLGIGGSINAARTAIQAIRPNYCIMPGICMGLREDISNITDLLVAEQVTDCETGKVTETDVHHRGRSLPGDPVLLSAARMADAPAKVHFGEILSGVKVINNKELAKQTKESYPNAVGLEMEGYGVASACITDHTPFVLIKSICDWGYNKDDENQAKAAENAMSYALNLISLLVAKENTV